MARAWAVVARITFPDGYTNGWFLQTYPSPRAWATSAFAGWISVPATPQYSALQGFQPGALHEACLLELSDNNPVTVPARIDVNRAAVRLVAYGAGIGQ